MLEEGTPKQQQDTQQQDKRSRAAPHDLRAGLNTWHTVETYSDGTTPKP